ncbi:MAG: tetratricopeptide repeat protein [Phaeodactylibacter sp.]|nr:tetratricopeptide repeat protein [Phaeodactylibacter sp.]
MRLFTRITIALLVFSALAGCKTQKKRGDISGISKAYHNTTTHYNYFYNAEVLYNESKLSLESQYKDNYNKILPVFKYLAADNPKGEAQNLDQAIEKMSIAISLHRYSDWADDCYLLIGQSQYMKQDFESAEETLEFLLAEYNPGQARYKGGKSSSSQKSTKTKSKKKKQKRKKRSKNWRKKASRQRAKGKGSKKKSEETEESVEEEQAINPGETTISIGTTQPEVEEGSPEGYFLKHRPAYQEGALWLARTYIERENFPEAERLILQLDKNPGTFKDVRRDLAPTEAHYYLKQKKYNLAIEPLTKAIDLADDKYLKARYAYILGQIHQRMGNEALAYERFEQVVKLRPTYEMEFSARLNLAQNAWATGNSTAEEAIKELERMVKDDKNVDYLDQIYYALANIYLNNKEVDKGIAHLKKSLAVASSNPAQKSEAYYKLASLYYSREDYVSAKYYYDSTMSVLARTDERYEDVERLAFNLTDIARNLEVIQLQDSLLAIYRMSDEEKRALATQIKQKQEEERRRAILQKAISQNSASASSPLTGNNFTQVAGQGTSQFWAYDDRTVKRGLRDFERKWGNRPLEDNWRRSSVEFGSLEEEEEAEEAVSSVLTDEDMELIFQDVPQNEQDVAVANKKIMDAYFALGKLYRDRLKKSEKAVVALETLFERFPDNPYELEAYYFLYLAHTDLGQTAKAKVYYDKIVSKYPDSPIAKSLTDPNYVKNTLDKERQLNKYYDATLTAFNNRQYQAAYDRISNVGVEFGGQDSHDARFALLRAMCIGNLKGRDEYIYSLKEVIGKYPDTPEETRAKEILRLLGAASATTPGGVTVDPNASPFVVEYDKIHYIIIAFDKAIDLTQAKTTVSDFNQKYNRLGSKLRISNIYLGDAEDRVPMIVIRRFTNKEEVMEYYDTVEKNSKDFLSSDLGYTVFAISQTNYRQILRNKTMDGYMDFFELHYID